MLCKKCGKELPDEAVFCGDCGAEVSVSEPVAADVSEDAFITINTQGQIPTGKKKKWLIPALVSGGIALVALVVAAIFLWPSLKNSPKASEKTPSEIHADVNQNDIEGKLDSIGNALDSWFSGSGGNFGYEGEIRLTLGEELLTMLSAEADLQWLSDIAVSYNLTTRDSLAQVILSMNMRDTEILSGEYIMDKENLQMWMLIPVLSEQALFVDLNEAMEESGAAPGLMIGDTYGNLPSWESASGILMPYMDLILNGFSDVKEAQETVKVEGVEQKLTILKAEMTPEQFCQVMIDVLETLKEDKELEQLIRDTLSSPDVEYDPYEDFLIFIDEGLKSFNMIMEESDFPEDEVMYLYTYLDDDENIVGRELGIDAADEDRVGFSYVTVYDDEEFGFELSFLEQLRITGSGEIDDEANGTFILNVEEEDFIKVEISDYAYDAEYPTGTIVITPMEAMLSAMFEDTEMDPSAQMMLNMLKFSLEINVSGTAQDNETSVRLIASGMEIITIEFTGKVTDPGEIVIPKDTVNAQDMEAMEQWEQSLNQEAFMETLMSRLAEAGVPEELLMAFGNVDESIPL